VTIISAQFPREITPRQALNGAMNNNCRYHLRTLKLYWADADDFLLKVSSLLLDVVPDELSGLPLLDTCLTYGISATATMLRQDAKCPDHLCIIDHFVRHTLGPVPRMLCWRFICETSGAQWDPTREPITEWRARHPLYSIQEAERLYTAAEADLFRARIRDHLLQGSVKAMLEKGNCTGNCKTPMGPV